MTNSDTAYGVHNVAYHLYMEHDGASDVIKTNRFANVEEALTKTEQYIEDNQKLLTRIVGGIVGVIALIIGVNNLYLKLSDVEAQFGVIIKQMNKGNGKKLL